MPEQKNNIYRPITASEIVVGLVILIVLAIVAVLVVMEQYDYDPGLFRLNPDLLNSPQQASSRPAPDILRRLGLKLKLSAGKIESFTPENVYEKIDGRDQAFLDLGLQSLDVIALSMPDQPEESFEVFIYNMAQPENAFGIFAANQTDDPDWSYGNAAGQAAPNAVFFYQGPYYICLIGSSMNAPLKAAIRQAAQALADMLPGQSARIWASQIFPADRLKPHSLRFALKGWLGTSFFDQVYTASYSDQNGDLTAYISRRSDPAQAETIFTQLHQFLLDNKAKIVSDDNRMTVAEFMGTFEIVFHEGRFVAGITQAPNQASALALAQKLQQSIAQYLQQNP
jgi:hypothetical protein